MVCFEKATTGSEQRGIQRAGIVFRGFSALHRFSRVLILMHMCVQILFSFI
jgi:hypothetical protein